jgi:6-pyruvoyltetrahydropterin/6-carboxytetrahydropterin synthase
MGGQMFRIERRFTFPMGHRLSKHGGKCKNFHGHNFEVYVGIQANELDKNDMVMDFSILKDIVQPYIDKFDHSFMLNGDDREFSEKLKELMPDMRIISIPTDPTAEILARTIFRIVADKLYEKGYSERVKIGYVAVFENENSCAIYEEP